MIPVDLLYFGLPSFPREVKALAGSAEKKGRASIFDFSLYNMMERSLHSTPSPLPIIQAIFMLLAHTPGWSIDPHSLDCGLGHMTYFDQRKVVSKHGSLLVSRRDPSRCCVLPVLHSYCPPSANNVPGVISPPAQGSKGMTQSRLESELRLGTKPSGVQWSPAKFKRKALSLGRTTVPWWEINVCFPKLLKLGAACCCRRCFYITNENHSLAYQSKDKKDGEIETRSRKL